ncbi:MAG: hypothetical protein J6Y37_12060 [Paludibacteraceae bacterium]|nr:hypothetical protein [Paludibacteraceae bacterium]
MEIRRSSTLSYETITGTMETFGRYLKMHRDCMFMTESLNIIGECNEKLKEWQNDAQKRLDNFNELVGKYWKMSYLEPDGLLKPIAYMLPYRIVKTNQYMFALVSEIDKPYPMYNGLMEKSYDLMDGEIAKHDLVFEEVDEDEIINYAKKQIDDALSLRLWKMKHCDDYSYEAIWDMSREQAVK